MSKFSLPLHQAQAGQGAVNRSDQVSQPPHALCFSSSTTSGRIPSAGSAVRGRAGAEGLTDRTDLRILTQQAKADVEESLEAIEDLEAQIQDLREELEEEIAEVTECWAETVDVVEKVEVRAKKADISVEAFGLAWVPRWQVTYEDNGVTRQLYLPAYDKIREANDDQRF